MSKVSKSTRGWLYWFAKFLGDVNTVKHRRVGYRELADVLREKQLGAETITVYPEQSRREIRFTRYEIRNCLAGIAGLWAVIFLFFL